MSFDDSRIPAWGRYENLRPAEIEAILEQRPIAYVPWGALEYHGRHDPVGLDGLKAQGLCLALAKATGGVVLPPVYHATSTIKTLKHLPHRRHSLEHGEETIRMLCRDLLTQLEEEGFRLIFILSGHIGEPHFGALKEEAARFGAEHPKVQAWVVAETDLVPESLARRNHAGFGETALMLHFDPASVALELLPKDRLPNLEQDAVHGDDPRKATPAAGAAIADAFVAAAGARIISAINLMLPP
jgi:creatinine amidohydrolase